MSKPPGCCGPCWKSDLQSRLQLYLQLIRWDRPAGWLLLLWPTLSALWVAARGFPGWHLLTVFTLGTILMRSAALRCSLRLEQVGQPLGLGQVNPSIAKRTPREFPRFGQTKST